MNTQISKFVSIVAVLWCCFFSGKKVHSQSYIKLIHNYSEWHVTTCNSGCLTDKYYTIGDTTINNLHYSFLDLYHYNKNFMIREDTLDRKIYMRQSSQLPNMMDYLLYDFSLQVSDTFSIQNPGSPYPLHAGDFILDSIVSKLLLFQNHRYFYFHALDTVMANTKNTVWIEGIGSLCLINTPGAMPQINGVGQLSCFFSNGIQHYQDLDSIANCISVYPVGVEELPSGTLFKILQNFEAKTVIIKSEGSNWPFSFELLSLPGSLKLKQESITATTYEINLNNFPEGILILKLTDRHGHNSSYKIVNY